MSFSTPPRLARSPPGTGNPLNATNLNSNMNGSSPLTPPGINSTRPPRRRNTPAEEVGAVVANTSDSDAENYNPLARSGLMNFFNAAKVDKPTRKEETEIISSKGDPLPVSPRKQRGGSKKLRKSKSKKSKSKKSKKNVRRN